MTLLQKSALEQAAPLWQGLHRNDELPGEMAIAVRAGVGRTVVRGLLRHLGRRGYIARRARKWVLKRPLPVPSDGGTDRAHGPRSKKDLVKEHLLAELTGGSLKPGQRVVELALARKLGVSTAVVREALLELHPLGAFVKKERRHWQVTSVNDEQLEALREFREMVEVFALRRLFERPPCPLVAASLARNRRRTEQVLASRKSTIREILDVDLEFHRLLLEASGNPLLPERAGFIYLIIEFQLVSPHFRTERGRFGLRRHLQAADQSTCAIARRMRRN